MTIKSNTFAEACYDANSIIELEEVLLNDADEGDMAQWNITADDWREQIALALTEKRKDEAS